MSDPQVQSQPEVMEMEMSRGNSRRQLDFLTLYGFTRSSRAVESRAPALKLSWGGGTRGAVVA